MLFRAIRFIFSGDTTCLKCVRLQGEPAAGRCLSIAIPASVVSDTPHLREKTAKLGAIARASSIFGVNEIILYADDPRRSQEADMQFCDEILQYLETPQYLRKKIFKLRPTFKFAGILPPLQAPHHNVPRTMASVKIGDIREGLVISRNDGGAVVDAGLERFVSVAADHPVSERVTIRLVSVGKSLRGEIIEPSKMRISRSSETPILAMTDGKYWGYRVHKAASLARLLNGQRRDLKIGTSRYGTTIQELLPSLSKALKNSRSTLIAFGSPKMGLREILAQEKLDQKDAFTYFVNTVPDQQTATVRTEEAIFISLGILNLAAKLTGS